jgi:hypothetical protein
MRSIAVVIKYFIMIPPSRHLLDLKLSAFLALIRPLWLLLIYFHYAAVFSIYCLHLKAKLRENPFPVAFNAGLAVLFGNEIDSYSGKGLSAFQKSATIAPHLCKAFAPQDLDLTSKEIPIVGSDS